MEQTNGFEPVFNKQARVLILGSHPGVQSLRKHQYYGNPGNAFWRVIFKALEVEDPIDYSKRLAVLLNHNVALWDVYKRVEREGSLDSKIKNETLNDFDRILDIADIQLIIGNGKTAYEEILKQSIFDSYEVIYALSTSGLNNGRERDRMDQWTRGIQYGLSKGS